MAANPLSACQWNGHDISALTGTVSTGFAGKDVAGTFNGVSATGVGQILTGAVAQHLKAYK
jgi:hypothetical protein